MNLKAIFSALEKKNPFIKLFTLNHLQCKIYRSQKLQRNLKSIPRILIDLSVTIEVIKKKSNHPPQTMTNNQPFT